MYHDGMQWLNFHHLLYFWTVAREGSVVEAARSLHLTQPTLSNQIRALERAIKRPLFDRIGRKLVLSETGKIVFRYADEIFTLGRELSDVLAGELVGHPVQFRVGIVDTLPKLVAYRFLAPVLSSPESVHLLCFEGTAHDLAGKLAGHELDVVLADTPLSARLGMKAYDHRLGRCPVSIMGLKPLAARYRRRFPKSLNGAPFLLPMVGTTLRRSLERWFDAQHVRPRIIGEFADSALLKVFGHHGAGLFAVPSVVETDVLGQKGLQVVGHVESISEEFYVVSTERRIKHPGVEAITQSARQELRT